MIDLDLIEQQCKCAIENGYGHLPVVECGNAVKLMEVINRLRIAESEIDELVSMLRQAEKDAERYRWLRDVGCFEQSADNFFWVDTAKSDSAIDEAMQCNK